jgi:calnexin
VLNQAFDNTNNTLVFQYEVRIHDGIGCSGAYAKLLLKQDNFDALALEEATPYVIMFGPDRCGSTNKVHFIVRQKLAEGKWEEKHLAKTVSAKTTDSYSHLYQLVIKPDNTFKILVDQHEEASGSLLSSTDFNPPFGAPKEIDDSTDSKPSDWVEEANIPDPAAKKPEAWDENAPKTIPDPDAKKPVDWSDEDDGEWMPSEIPNPEYKGKWSAPIIANPAYKGQWKPRKIPNPAFFEDLQPSNLAPIGAISFEILANDRGIAFDNVLLAHDEQAANEFASLTFTPKQASEKSHAEAVRKAKAEADRIRAFDEDGPYGMAVYVWGEVKEFVTSNLIAVIGTSVVLFLSCFYYMCLAPVRRHGRAEGDDDKVVIPAESDEDEGEESDNSDSKKPVVEETKETEQSIKEKKTKSKN